MSEQRRVMRTYVANREFHDNESVHRDVLDAWLSSGIDAWDVPEEARDDIFIEFSTTGLGSTVLMSAYYERPETDEEVQHRIHRRSVERQVHVDQVRHLMKTHDITKDEL